MLVMKRYFFKDGIELNPDNVWVMKQLEKAKEDYLKNYEKQFEGKSEELVRDFINSLPT